MSRDETPSGAQSGTRRPSSAPKFKDMSSLKSYEIIQKLGQGTFGVVQKARNIQTNQIVALKQLLNHSAKEGFPITAMREITILKKLKHTNVLLILDMIYQPSKSGAQDNIHQRGCFYTVSPYMGSDLVGLLENPRIKLSLPQIKCIMQQLLRGVQYIHEQMYLHRDIKAANILIDAQGVLKVADFGLARHYHGKPPRLGEGPGGGERDYTGLVVTRWYRPPEILLGERKYTTAVDMWGVGCVFGELFVHKPILAGQTDSQQAHLIFDLVGPPNQINWAKAGELPNKADFAFGLKCKRTLETKFSRFLDECGLELLAGFLRLDPYTRLNAADALNHPYFTSEPLPSEGLPEFEESHEIDKERFKKLRGEAQYKEKLQETKPKPKPPSGPEPPAKKLQTYRPSTLPDMPSKKETSIANRPTIRGTAGGVFMSQNRKPRAPKRPASSEPPSKRKQTEPVDSDLTDFDEDMNGENEKKLNKFLDPKKSTMDY